jgi:transposase
MQKIGAWEMIKMTDFKQIIQLRNQGLTQDEIANKIGISRRSVIRYLKSGDIPSYQRKEKSTRPDPLAGFYDTVENNLSSNQDLSLSELFEYLQAKGYEGSIRTLRRKTLATRRHLKTKEVYFQRLAIPGEIMEGDFTEMYIEIGGTQRKVYLWVTSLPYSNFYFASGFYHCTFECFAQGSVDAFNEFGGIAKKYRLDNLSPAVSKILKGHERKVTQRFAEFQNHFGFMQDFCNPAKGNEKGNVEANNKWLKKKISSQISLNKVHFRTLEAFNAFVVNVCREHNKKDDIQIKKAEEQLSSLPIEKFNCFKTEIVSINKYSLFSLGNTGHMYSVPSAHVGLSLEARVFPTEIQVISQGVMVCKHNRIYGPSGLVSIMPEHIISALVKKPNAMGSWKYRHVLFERPAWNQFYERIKSEGGTDKEYLRCLKLLTTHGKEIVTIAMEILLDDKEKLSLQRLEKIITNNLDDILELSPIVINLHHYDDLIKGENNEDFYTSRT